MKSPAVALTRGVLNVRNMLAAPYSLVRAASTSLNTALQVLDGPVVLYQPSNGQAGSYIGTANVVDVHPHLVHRTLTLELAEIDFFETPLPLVSNGIPMEPDLADENGNIQFQRLAPGLRLIERSTYDRLVATRSFLDHLFESSPGSGPSREGNVQEPRWSLQRRRERIKLRQEVLRLYNGQCMLSGDPMTMPEGRSLLEVSHFRSLKHRGPDELSNVGLKTPDIHNIYENGLIAILPSREILFAPDIPVGMRAKYKGRTYADFPAHPDLQPDPEQLNYHRVNVFEARL